jgi:large subunit ribosomal protein L17
MRHRKLTIKLGRTTAQRGALLSAQVCSLITAGRITTTLEKAKASRRLADRMVTLGKRNTLATRRLAISRLRKVLPVGILFSTIAPAMAGRSGGYTRILKLGRRTGDGAELAILEWVTYTPPAPKATKEKTKPS